MPLEGINSSQFDKFAAFASEKVAGNDGSSIARLGDDAPVRNITAADPDRDEVGKAHRNSDECDRNNKTRQLFRKAVADLFGGEGRIPHTVRKAMILKDYGRGKPLTARRIDVVRQAVERHFAAYPAAFARAKAKASDVYARFDAQAVNAAIAQALSPVIGDPDATQIVIDHADELFVSPNGRLLTEDEIRKKVQGLLDNVRMLRNAAKGDRTTVDDGFNLLAMLCDRTLPRGMFSGIFAGVKAIPVKAFKGVKPGCGAAKLNRAIGLSLKAPKALLARSGAGAVLKNSPEKARFLAFVEKLVLEKCTRRELQLLHETLHGEDGRKLLRFYEDFENGNGAPSSGDVPSRKLKEMRRLAPEYAGQVRHFASLVAAALDMAPEDGGEISPAPEKVELSGADIDEICEDFLETLEENPEDFAPAHPASRESDSPERDEP